MPTSNENMAKQPKVLIPEVKLQSRIAELAQDPRHVPWHATSRSALVVPLINGSERIGVINVESGRQAAFSADDELTLETIATQLAAAIAVARLHDREKRAAITDGLTGVFNHRHFYQRLEQELARAERHGHPLVLMILDLNGLKALNDTHGHLAGDAALRLLSSRLHECVRRHDIVARYGGDEFAVILPETAVGEARQLVERLQTRLLASRTTSDDLAIGPLTVSVGLAVYPADGTRAAALVAAADSRMYQQKVASRTPRHERIAHLQARRNVLSLLKEE